MKMKMKIGLIIYFTIVVGFLFSAIGYAMYREAVIFPPVKPANLEELATWNESDLWRLMEYYNCRDRPSSNIPDDLKEFVKFCNTVSGHWSKKYRESKYDDARKGADKLRQE